MRREGYFKQFILPALPPPLSKFMEERVERIEDHIHQLEQLRVHDAEEYNLVKIKLETDVKVLEQQLQQMRATYQLNTEKLEYNFQVLKKREEENGTILGAQKRKIARLTDHLNTLKAKLAKQEKGFHQEYIALTDDYKRITEQFKVIETKRDGVGGRLPLLTTSNTPPPPSLIFRNCKRNLGISRLQTAKSTRMFGR